jgi:hypothetical protein
MGPEHRCGKCGVGVLPFKPAEGQEALGHMVVVEREPSGAHHFRGLETCAKAWLCPVCSVPIMMRRAAEVTVATARWQQGVDVDPDTGQRCGDEGIVLLVTFTVPHAQDDPLDMVLGGLLGAWGNMVRSSRWRTWASRFELDHWVRSVEITVGHSGWHPHVHALLYLRKWPDENVIGHLEAELWRMWSHGLQLHGIDRQLSVTAGIDLRQVTDHRDLGHYLNKWAIGHEVVDAGTLKNGRGGASIPAMGLLDEIAAYGPSIHQARVEDPFAGWLCARWDEYARATKGKHQFRSSRGWRKSLIPDMEALTPEEAVAWGERLRIEDQHLIGRELASTQLGLDFDQAPDQDIDAHDAAVVDELVDIVDEDPGEALHGPVLAMSYPVWFTVFRRLEHAQRSPHAAILDSCVTRGALQTARDLASMCPEFIARIWLTPDGTVVIADKRNHSTWERWRPDPNDRHCDAA